ncbi:MAG: hypothetical protein OXF39_00555 [Nitrospira sp.]|nr:hypothetical protein [Nitrospira sp.]
MAMKRSKKAFVCTLVLVLTLFGIGSVCAEDEQLTKEKQAAAKELLRKSFKDLFQLYTNCKRMDLVVETLSPDAAKIGLTRRQIIAAVESRLRSARLYSNDRKGVYLYVNVTVIGSAFNIFLSFSKTLHDPISTLDNFAETWKRGSTGTHGRSGAAYIVSSVSLLIDEFLVEYLRVNEKACERK